MKLYIIKTTFYLVFCKKLLFFVGSKIHIFWRIPFWRIIKNVKTHFFNKGFMIIHNNTPKKVIFANCAISCGRTKGMLGIFSCLCETTTMPLGIISSLCCHNNGASMHNFILCCHYNGTSMHFFSIVVSTMVSPGKMWALLSHWQTTKDARRYYTLTLLRWRNYHPDSAVTANQKN